MGFFVSATTKRTRQSMPIGMGCSPWWRLPHSCPESAGGRA
nr:MAG TPA: hypothetical protein [Caudoviricetes sp.]